MIRMTKANRLAWRDDTKRQHAAITRQVAAGHFHCDNCPDAAVAISAAADTPVRVECARHFKARLERERAERPSREELAARVSAAIGR